MPICIGARRKIKRAYHHIAELETCIDSLKKRLLATAHVDANTGCEYIKCGFADAEESEILEGLSAIIGDAVHNMKCALDHVWFETVRRLIPSGSWGKTRFPVYPTRDDLELALRKLEIDVSSPYFFRFIIGQIKPYDTGDWAIRPMHKLDIRDKHRLLIPAIYYSSIGDIYLEDQYGEVHTGSTWATTQLPYYVTFERGLHIKDPGRASCAVMFQQGDAGTETRAADTLHGYCAHVLMIVKLFEEFTEAWGI
jgi:hypothetical protein